MRSFAVLVCVVVATAGVVLCEPIVTADLVASINASPKALWRASAASRVARMERSDAARLCGTKLEAAGGTLRARQYGGIVGLPESFDSRKQWPMCDSMNDIWDQSDCGSCWAFGAAETMSDRECIARGYDLVLSAEDINSCFTTCGSCSGGYVSCAWADWLTLGVVTQSCMPYSIPPCSNDENSSNPCPEDLYPTPPCESQCVDGTEPVPYLGKDAWSVFGESNYLAEIYNNGPCEPTFTVYEDFYSYTGGIYHHITGSAVGGHAVKFIGWGIENGTKFWTAANSWGVDWGENGFFRILRGTNECGIESGCFGGNPVV
ncbi:cathepsin B [Pelomyxa schiedti]|nr:cathepsin B [Pelomyxa schiedti]